MTCARCGRPREVIRLEVCGVGSDFTRPCEHCAPEIVRERQDEERLAQMRSALNDCGTVRPAKVPPVLATFTADVVAQTMDAGALAVLVGGIESGKTTVAQGWVVGMVERGLRALYLPAAQAMASGADALVADWARFDAVAIDGLAQDGARLAEWQSTRLAILCSELKEGRLLLTTPWSRRMVIGGQDVDGWAWGLGAPAAARLATRARQRPLPARRA